MLELRHIAPCCCLILNESCFPPCYFSGVLQSIFALKARRVIFMQRNASKSFHHFSSDISKIALLNVSLSYSCVCHCFISIYAHAIDINCFKRFLICSLVILHNFELSLCIEWKVSSLSWTVTRQMSNACHRVSETGPGNCQESERRGRTEKKKTWEEKDGRRYRARGQKKKIFYLITEDQKKTPPQTAQ